MNEKPRSSSCFVLSISVPISFILGLIIGLVVLGWWLWPVEWSGGDVAMLGPGAQLDYLSAVVNAYAYDQDASLAQSRFAGLGESRNAVLSALYAAEPDRAGEIERFAEAVGASAALAAPSETEAAGPTQEPAAEPAGGAAPLLARFMKQPLLTVGAICIGLVVLVALILLLAVGRGRRSKPAIETMQPEPPQPEPVGYEAPLAFGETEAPEAAAPETPEETLPGWLDMAEAPDADLAAQLDEKDYDELLEDTAPRTITTESIEELPVSTDEELTDEDIAAITSQDFTPSSMAGLGAAAIFDDSMTREGIHFPGSVEQTDFEEAVPSTEIWTVPPAAQADITADDTLTWLESAAAEETAETPPALIYKADETPEETEAKFSQDIETVAAIGPEEAAQLRLAGVSLPLLLLRQGATPEGRRDLAQETGIHEDRLLEWVKFLDLYRIKGVDRPQAELLKMAGVEGVPALAASDPSSLYLQMTDAANRVATDASLPSYTVVEAWIEQARRLPHAVME